MHKHLIENKQCVIKVWDEGRLTRNSEYVLGTYFVSDTILGECGLEERKGTKTKPN